MFNRLDLIKNQLKSNDIFIKEITRLNQGENSSSYKVITENNNYALKIYPENIVNDRNRLKSELEFLVFLKKFKFRTVPNPIIWDKKNKWLLLSWINGDKISECGIKKGLNVVDLTGAGDLFAAGFLHGHVNDMSLQDCLEKGTDMSSQIIQQIGARL